MPDLTNQVMRQCAQMGDGYDGKEFFLRSDSDPHIVYTVRMFSSHLPVNCTCPAAVNNRGGKWRDELDNARCKHVKYIQDSVCSWAELSGPERYQNDDKCPRCGGSVERVLVAV